ncbi:MAG: ATP-binding protein [Scytonematopsis contorta HA4267-MV1]|jgi:hypothetical protein|nr:ATP-binding protein [Scytonematopsis contorta HA4267-MV1]
MVNIKPFESETASLEQEVWQKRLIHLGVSLTAITLPLTAVIVPNQAVEAKLWQLALGTLFGGASAYIAQNRIDIENRYETFLNLRKEATKEAIKKEFGFNLALQQIDAELKLADVINRLKDNAKLRYLDIFQLHGLLNLNPQEQPQNLILEGTPSVETLEPPKLTSDIQWLIELVSQLVLRPLDKRKHHNFIIHGGSQSGKSTLVSAIILLAAHLLGKTGSKVKINLIDPKYPESNWAFEPNYKDYSEVLPGLQTSFQELEKIRKEAKKLGKSVSNKYGFTFTLIDEQDNIYGGGDGYPDKISKPEVDKIINLESALIKEGAAYNFCTIVIGQSPLNQDTGFNRQIYKNATHIVLGDAALSWIKDNSFPYKKSVDELETLCYRHLNDGERFALVIPKGGLPYITGLSTEIKKLVVYGFNQTVEGEESAPSQQSNQQTQNQHPNDHDSDEWSHQNEHQNQPQFNPLNKIREWCWLCRDKFGSFPNSEEIAEAWRRLTGQQLTASGLKVLIEKLDLNSED